MADVGSGGAPVAGGVGDGVGGPGADPHLLPEVGRGLD